MITTKTINFGKISAAVLGLTALAACGTVNAWDKAQPTATATASVSTTVQNDTANPNVNPNIVGPSQVQGTVGGVALTPRSTVFATVQTFSGSYVMLMIADVDNLCDKLQANKAISNMTSLAFTISSTTVGNDPIGCSINDLSSAYSEAMLQKSDAACADTQSFSQGWANGGSVQLTQLDANTAQGTFTLQVGSSNAIVQGQFNATYCAAASINLSDAAANGCN